MKKLPGSGQPQPTLLITEQENQALIGQSFNLLILFSINQYNIIHTK